MASRPTIARTLTVLIAVVSGLALFGACLAFALYDRNTSRAAAVRNLSVQAQIVGDNSVTALLFNDPQAADATLGALRAAPALASAEIYTPDGRLFAGYQRDASADVSAPLAIPPGATEMVRFDAQQFEVSRRIIFQNKPVGSVTIRSTYAELDQRRRQYIAMMATVLAAAILAASLLSWIAQRTISKAIVELAQTAATVSRGKDYSVRATTEAHTSEVAALASAFNDMLSQIQVRDRSLSDAAQALETRVEERTAELAAVNQELEAFSYSVSHDLRAPLRHITGFAAMLEAHAQAQLDDQGRRYLLVISAAAKQMGQLIDDLLAFSRISRGQLARRPLRLNDVLREAKREVERDVNGRRVTWRIADLPDVEGDAAMLRLVMVNLLSNALKYSGTRDETLIEVGGSRDDTGDVVVFVRDNGVGFDMQYVHKLFGVFQRLHTSDQFSGTGIGLANVKRIVHRHGGRVWAESELDRGATFYFSLPTKGPSA